jgi:hypothetical protein
MASTVVALRVTALRVEADLLQGGVDLVALSERA